MATRSWLDELAQQAEDGSARLQEMLSVGLGFLRTELGLDLGLEPKRYPGWVILAGTGSLGLLLLFLLGYGWAAACAGARKKRRSPPRKREEAAAAAAPAPAADDHGALKNLRSEEQKKKNRKKLPEKPKVSRGGAAGWLGEWGAPRPRRAIGRPNPRRPRWESGKGDRGSIVESREAASQAEAAIGGRVSRGWWKLKKYRTPWGRWVWRKEVRLFGGYI